MTHASSQQNSCSARLKVGFGGMGAVASDLHWPPPEGQEYGEGKS